ncbi:MAG: hypothetical protein ACREP7_15390 [Lysobacter sp.]
MSYPDCQYSHVTWVMKDSAAYKALTEGLKNDHTAANAVTAFLTTLTTAHKDFNRGLHPGADMTALLRAYQNKTGIISSRDYTLPDIPSNPNDPDNSFVNDLIAGIAGAVVTEIGIGITLYTLVLDLIEIFEIKLHLQGLLFNTAPTDLMNIDFRYGPNGLPNLLPLSQTIPAAKSIMNPLDKKNYDCVAFTLFGGVGFQSLEGFFIALHAERKRHSQTPVYCQFYASDRGIAPGVDDRDHAPLREVFRAYDFTGVMVDTPSNPNGMVAIFCH